MNKLQKLKKMARELNTAMRPSVIADDDGQTARSFEEWLVWMGHYTEEQLRLIKEWGSDPYSTAEHLEIVTGLDVIDGAP